MKSILMPFLIAATLTPLLLEGAERKQAVELLQKDAAKQENINKITNFLSSKQISAIELLEGIIDSLRIKEESSWWSIIGYGGTKKPLPWTRGTLSKLIQFFNNQKGLFENETIKINEGEEINFDIFLEILTLFSKDIMIDDEDNPRINNQGNIIRNFAEFYEICNEVTKLLYEQILPERDKKKVEISKIISQFVEKVASNSISINLFLTYVGADAHEYSWLKETAQRAEAFFTNAQIIEILKDRFVPINIFNIPVTVFTQYIAPYAHRDPGQEKKSFEEFVEIDLEKKIQAFYEELEKNKINKDTYENLIKNYANILGISPTTELNSFNEISKKQDPGSKAQAFMSIFHDFLKKPKAYKHRGKMEVFQFIFASENMSFIDSLAKDTQIAESMDEIGKALKNNNKDDLSNNFELLLKTFIKPIKIKHAKIDDNDLNDILSKSTLNGKITEFNAVLDKYTKKLEKKYLYIGSMAASAKSYLEMASQELPSLNQNEQKTLTQLEAFFTSALSFITPNNPPQSLLTNLFNETLKKMVKENLNIDLETISPQKLLTMLQPESSMDREWNFMVYMEELGTKYSSLFKVIQHIPAYQKWVEEAYAYRQEEKILEKIDSLMSDYNVEMKKLGNELRWRNITRKKLKTKFTGNLVPAFFNPTLILNEIEKRETIVKQEEKTMIEENITEASKILNTAKEIKKEVEEKIKEHEKTLKTYTHIEPINAWKKLKDIYLAVQKVKLDVIEPTGTKRTLQTSQIYKETAEFIKTNLAEQSKKLKAFATSLARLEVAHKVCGWLLEIQRHSELNNLNLIKQFIENLREALYLEDNKTKGNYSFTLTKDDLKNKLNNLTSTSLNAIYDFLKTSFKDPKTNLLVSILSEKENPYLQAWSKLGKTKQPEPQQYTPGTIPSSFDEQKTPPTQIPKSPLQEKLEELSTGLGKLREHLENLSKSLVSLKSKLTPLGATST